MLRVDTAGAATWMLNKASVVAAGRIRGDTATVAVRGPTDLRLREREVKGDDTRRDASMTSRNGGQGGDKTSTLTVAVLLSPTAVHCNDLAPAVEGTANAKVATLTAPGLVDASAENAALLGQAAASPVNLYVMVHLSTEP